MSSSEAQTPELSTLEQMGALCSLLIHELANHMCVISGNAAFAQTVRREPSELDPALDAITEASELASRVLNRCSVLRHRLAEALPPGQMTEASLLLRRSLTGYPGWTIPSEAIVSEPLKAPSVWIAFAVRQVIAESGAERGEVSWKKVAPKKRFASASPTSPLLEIRLAYEGGKTLSIREARTSYEDLGLLAAFELIRASGGGLEGRAVLTTGRQEVIIEVPLAPADELTP
jgi:hypothetical protein